MKEIPSRALLLASALALGVTPTWAQSAPTAATTPASRAAQPVKSLDPLSDDEVLTLDPFTVTTDQEGYLAKDTLGGARVRTKIADTPSAISVITPKLMQDLGVTNAESLLVYTNNTEIAGLGGNFSGMTTRGQGISIAGAAEGTRLVNPAGVNRARGLTAMDSTRNYFLSDIPWDGYNISRVDISRGPNSFLFGVGSPSGISNVSTNEALFKNKGSVEAKVGSFGSTRESVDLNRVIIPSVLAVRVDLVNDDTQFQQKPAFNHSQREYGALRWDPKLFGESNHTKIQANIEHGKIDSNNPRTLPPLDYVTGYLNDPAASKTGYNPWTYKMDSAVSANISQSSWAGAGSIGNQNAFGNGSPELYWDAVTGTLQKAGQASFTSPTTAGYGSYSNTYNVHSVGFGTFANTENYKYLQSHNNVDGGPYRGAHSGAVAYLDKTLADPSIFDFYHKLVDGPNKHEWQRWNAFNVSIVQTLFEDRLSLQAVVDHERHSSGSSGLLNSRTPILMLDLNSYNLTTPTWLSGGDKNPNVGRPQFFGDQGNNDFYESTHTNYQLTAAYSLDFQRDFATKGALGSILGRHEITGLGGQYDRSEESRSYRLNGIDSNYQVLVGNTAAAPQISNNGYNWTAYVGASMLGTKGSGANLTNLRTMMTPPSAYPYTIFSKTWTAGSSVKPTDPWTYTGPDGNQITQVQADNPANYQGYTGMNIPTIYGDSHPDSLATGGSKKRQTITSKALLYQGHFWDDTIIPTFGYRQDTTKQRGNAASNVNPAGIYNLNYSITDTGVQATTKSKSWGVTLHLPKAIKKNLPEGTDVSLYYFHGATETPKVRYSIDGSQLPNETGKTDDYAIQLDGLKGRATLRLTYFKTVDSNAQASYGQPLGGSGWLIDALPQWTLIQTATALAWLDQPNNLPSDFPTWTQYWPGLWAAQNPDVGHAIGNVLKTDFVKMFPQSYWDAYGYNIDVAAIQRGDWVHIVKGHGNPWYDYSGGNNHMIHGEYGIIDQNIESKGYELEATIRPMKNWDITFNGSKVSATQTALGADVTNYLNQMAKLWVGTPLGRAAEWGYFDPDPNGGAFKKAFLSGLWAPYLAQVALTGADQPEMRKYHFNVISNYTFDHGVAKGLNVGGAYRWESKSILGYGTHLADVQYWDQKQWIADITQPIYGPTDAHFDAWIGYSHKLSSKIDWRIQLNLRNVGEKVHLVKVAVEPDGTTAQSRILNGQTVELSTKFSF
jgi:hypothetical protein